MDQISIDLNSDVGEGFGPYEMGQDAGIFPHISSANIACGFHAGDPSTIRKTLELAARHQVAVGAHPGFPDRLHFGRVALPYSNAEIVDFVLYQIGSVQLMAESAGLKLQHVKLHGALYHLAAYKADLAESILDAIVRLHEPPILVGPPNSILQKEAEERGLSYAAEGFADRAYQADGTLTPRSDPRGVIADPGSASEQALGLAKHHRVKSVSGSMVELRVSTLCIHGDTPGAPGIAQSVRQKLEEEHISILPLAKMID